MNENIRKFRDGDIERAAEIWLAGSLQAHDFVPNSFWRDNLPDLKDKYLPGAQGYVYLVDAIIQGVLVYNGDFIHLLFVDPMAQRQGIGTALIQTVQAQHKTLKLTVYVQNRKPYGTTLIQCKFKDGLIFGNRVRILTKGYIVCCEGPETRSCTGYAIQAAIVS